MGVFFTAFLLLGGACAFSVYKGYEDFPEYAKKEVVYKKYGTYIKEVKEVIKNSDSKLSLAANLEKLPQAKELLYFGLDYFGSEGDDLDIVKNYDGGSTSTFSTGETGYGTVDGIKIIIIKIEVTKFDPDFDVKIYLRHHENQD